MGNCFGSRKVEKESVTKETKGGSQAERIQSMAANYDPLDTMASLELPQSTITNSKSLTNQSMFSDAVSSFTSQLNISKRSQGDSNDVSYEVPAECRIVTDSYLLDKIGKRDGATLWRADSNNFGLILSKTIQGSSNVLTNTLFNNELEALTYLQLASPDAKRKKEYRSKSPFKAGYENKVYKWQHDNVIGFIGYAEYESKAQGLQRRLLTEFYVDTLRTHIEHRTLKGKKSMKTYEASLYAYQISKGLYFLHKKRIIHRDISSETIIMGQGLLDREYKDWLKYISKEQTKTNKSYSNAAVDYYRYLKTQPLIAKLAHFGHSKKLEKGERTSTVIGNIQFMAPEMIKQQKYNSKVDIWSFGCVLYELLASKPPFNKKPNSVIENKVLNGKFPRKDLVGGRDFENLNVIMRNCLKLEPALRCKARDLVDDLGKL